VIRCSVRISSTYVSGGLLGEQEDLGGDTHGLVSPLDDLS
jgi:hypothetical protein